jgi:branched-subunit amino acid aminotransferase/4-amino-4-deoxychorismate lyase
MSIFISTLAFASYNPELIVWAKLGILTGSLDVNGYISEGAGENLFEVKDGILFTPPFTSSALPGITRDAIIKLAQDLGIEVREQVLSRESLYLAANRGR